MAGRGRWNGTAIGMLALGVMTMSGCESLGIHDTNSLLFPGLLKSEIWGFIAGLGTTLAGLPDLISMLKRRSTAGMNPRMAGILAVFQVLWIYYGLLIVSRPVIAWNIIAVVINSLTVGAYTYFSRREKALSV